MYEANRAACLRARHDAVAVNQAAVCWRMLQQAMQQQGVMGVVLKLPYALGLGAGTEGRWLQHDIGATHDYAVLQRA